MAAGLAQMRAALRETAYRRFLFTNAVSLIGVWVQRTSVGWLAWELTGSAAWLGFVVFADFFPTILIGPFGGVLADRHDRRTIMVRALTVMTLLSVLLGLLSGLDLIGIAGLSIIVALHGAVIGINQPARLALVPALVDRERLPTAIALNAIAFNGARFIGPACAGLLIATAGVGAAFLFNALSTLPLILMLSRLRLPAPEPRAHAGVFEEIVEALRAITGAPVLGPVFLIFIIGSILVRPVGDLLPGVADGVFGEGSTGLAILSSTFGIGAVIGGFWTAGHGRSADLPSVLTAQLWVCLAVTAFALSPTFWFATAAIGVVGFVLIIAAIEIHTLIQLTVDGSLRGRVMSLFGLIFRSAPAIGALSLGLAAEGVGLDHAMLAGAVLFGASLLVLALRLRAGRSPPAAGIDRAGRGP